MLPPPTPMLDVIFVGNFPQPPLNHSREKEWPPLKIIIAHPLGKLWMFPKTQIDFEVPNSKQEKTGRR